MTARAWLGSAKRLASRVGIWLANTLLQDWFLRLLRGSVPPILAGLVGLGGALGSVQEATRVADQIEPGESVAQPGPDLGERWQQPRPSEPEVETPELPAEHQEPSQDEPFVAIPLKCTDSQGDTGVFDAVVFSRSYSWSLASEEEVRLNAKAADFRAVLRSPGMAKFLEAPEVIAVGAASCEGYPEHREREIERAGERARQLLAWIEDVRRPRAERRSHVPVRALNLGVYAHPCSSEKTWKQRRILLLALYEADSGLSLRDCLKEALLDEPDLRHLATEYEPGLGAGQTFFRRAE